MLHMNIQEPYEAEAADREELLCPVCFHINGPEADRCAHCINPLGPCINLDPIGYIWTRGFLLLRAKHVPPSRLVLLGAWLAVLPFMVFWALFFAIGYGYWSIPLVLTFDLPFLVLLFHITRNALRAAPDLDEPPAE